MFSLVASGCAWSCLIFVFVALRSLASVCWESLSSCGLPVHPVMLFGQKHQHNSSTSEKGFVVVSTWGPCNEGLWSIDDDLEHIDQICKFSWSTILCYSWCFLVRQKPCIEFVVDLQHKPLFPTQDEKEVDDSWCFEEHTFIEMRTGSNATCHTPT